MRSAIAIVTKLSAAMFAALLLAPVLIGARPQESPNPTFRGNKAGCRNQGEHSAKARDNYQFYTIDLPEGGVLSGGVGTYGINDRGLAAVVYADAAGNGLTLLWWNGRRKQLDYQGSPIADLEKVSNRGVACGQVGSLDFQHAALFDTATGTWTLLPDVAAKPMNFCLKINDAGIAVGNACEGTYWVQTNCTSWIWNGNSYSFTTIPNATDQYTGPVVINDRGQMIGQYVDENGHRHSYLQEGSKTISVDVPGALDTFANDLNNSGEVLVTGVSGDSLQSYVWKKGVFTALPRVPGAPITYAVGMNDQGDIGGKWCDENFVACHPFVAIRKSPRE